MSDEPKATFVGVDYGSGDDWSAEIEWQKTPEGKLEIKALHAWKHDLDLTAEPDSAPPSVDPPSPG